MVGISLDWTRDPVSAAHAAVKEANGDVAAVLRAATLPPSHSIPSVGDPAATPGSWARFTGMVQDVWDAELFVATSAAGHSGLLVEDAAASSAPNPSLSERLPVYLVSMPGETAWVRASRAPARPSVALAAPGGQKRAREEDAMTDAAPASVAPGPQRAVGPASAVAMDAQEKRAKPAESAAGTQPGFPGMGLNLPVSSQPGASAIVAKLYDNISGSGLKINTVVEVVGVVQDAMEVMPSGAANGTEFSDAFAAEFAARNPSNVQRLHVVAIREVEEWETNPAAAMAATAGAPRPTALQSARMELRAVLPSLREMVVRYLASALCDDVLAAEYVLMCLLSRPAQRTGAGGVLGKLSLNVVLPSSTSENSTFMKNLVAAIENIVPSVVRIDVNIAALNSMDLLPKKDYTANRLKAAPLQLPTGCCLLADESALSNGQLAERGVKNVRALTAVSQKLSTPVDFQYYESELPVHCSTLFVSVGGKSIVPTDVVVRVAPNENLGLQAWNSYEEDLLRKIRLGVALLVENGKFDISEDATKAVETAYVTARKNGQAKDGQETLQSWLAVARMSARSFGEEVLSAERWQYTMELEAKRESRGRS